VNVRWRLMVLALQLCMLCGATFELTGRPYSSETWFTAGLLALIVNPQLLEPYYPRPADVVVNCIIGIVLYLTTARNVAIAGWNLLVIGLALALVLGLIALVFGAGRRDGRLLPVARFATILTRSASSRVIYSAIYWLAVLEFRSVGSNDFWLLTFTWVVVTGLGLVNWQAAWSALSAGPMPCTAEGMMGPSLLLLSSASLPSPGTAVRLRAAGHLA
jgi:hypothetical protein